jgi:polyamine oxidase
VQGLGSNPVNQLSKKWGLKVTPNDGADVVFYDNHGKINGTKEYNDFNDALDATYGVARMFILSNWI